MNRFIFTFIIFATIFVSTTMIIVYLEFEKMTNRIHQNNERLQLINNDLIQIHKDLDNNDLVN